MDAASNYRKEIGIKRLHGWAQDPRHQDSRFFQEVPPSFKWAHGGGIAKALLSITWSLLVPQPLLLDPNAQATPEEKATAYYQWEEVYIPELRKSMHSGVPPTSVLTDMRSRIRTEQKRYVQGMVLEKPGSVCHTIDLLEKDGVLWQSCLDRQGTGAIWGDVSILYDLFVMLMRKNYPLPGRASVFSRAYDEWQPDWSVNISTNVSLFEKAYVDRENPKSLAEGVQMDTIYANSHCRNMVTKFVRAYELAGTRDKVTGRYINPASPPHAEPMYEAILNDVERAEADIVTRGYSYSYLSLSKMADESWSSKERELQAAARMSS